MTGPLDAHTLLVAVPPDFGSLRGTDPVLARRWRVAIRDTLGTAMADAAQVVGFDRAGWYAVPRGPQRTEEHR